MPTPFVKSKQRKSGAIKLSPRVAASLAPLVCAEGRSCGGLWVCTTIVVFKSPVPLQIADNVTSSYFVISDTTPEGKSISPHQTKLKYHHLINFQGGIYSLAFPPCKLS